VSQCTFHDYWGRDVEVDPTTGWCLLHATDPAKDTHAFAEAFAMHRERHGDTFCRCVFPKRADCRGTTFTAGGCPSAGRSSTC
jgi:hypothetical protein